MKHVSDWGFLAHRSRLSAFNVIAPRLPFRQGSARIRNTFLVLRVMRAGLLNLSLRASPARGLAVEFLSWHDHARACWLPNLSVPSCFFRQLLNVSVEAVQALIPTRLHSLQVG